MQNIYTMKTDYISDSLIPKTTGHGWRTMGMPGNRHASLLERKLYECFAINKHLSFHKEI